MSRQILDAGQQFQSSLSIMLRPVASSSGQAVKQTKHDISQVFSRSETTDTRRLCDNTATQDFLFGQKPSKINNRHAWNFPNQESNISSQKKCTSFTYNTTHIYIYIYIYTTLLRVCACSGFKATILTGGGRATPPTASSEAVVTTVDTINELEWAKLN